MSLCFGVEPLTILTRCDKIPSFDFVHFCSLFIYVHGVEQKHDKVPALQSSSCSFVFPLRCKRPTVHLLPF